MGSAPAAKPHLSPSQLETFAMCGERWRRRYIEGDVAPPGVAAMMGKSVHSTAEQNFRQKLDSHEDLPIDDFKEIAAENFKAQVKGDYHLTPEEHSRGKRVVLKEAKEEAIRMAGFHGAEQAPDYQPEIVEQAFRIELPNNTHDLIGVIDLADDQRRIPDFKTTSKRKNQAEADNSVQLTAYHVGYRVLTGSEPAGLQLDTIVRAKKGLSRDVIRTQRTLADVQALAHRLNVITNSINAGIFTPAPPGAWWCGPKWCGYWSSCPFVNSERAAAAEANGS